jgi:hypothetical protein
MAPSPVWTAGLDWPCSKLEVPGWDMGLHDPGRGPRSQMAFFTAYEQIIEWDPDAPLKRASQGGVPPGAPPRVCPQLALGSSPVASKVTNPPDPLGLGRRVGPIRQVRRDCLGGAKPHLPPDFWLLIPTRHTVAPILRSGAKPLFVRRKSSRPPSAGAQLVPSVLTAEPNIRRRLAAERTEPNNSKLASAARPVPAYHPKQPT